MEDSTDVGSERRKNATVLVNTEESLGVNNIIQIERHHNLAKLLSVTGYVQRFIEDLKRSRAGREMRVGPLSIEEIERTERTWIKDTQLLLKGREDCKKLSVQLGMTSEEKLLMCKGRLGNSNLEYRSKYPIILPKDSGFTDLLIQDCHARVHHNQLCSTLTELRGPFWIPQGRQQVKRVIRKCQICRRQEGKPFKPSPPSDWPDFMVNETFPFNTTGVDFAGPLCIKGGSAEMQKV